MPSLVEKRKVLDGRAEVVSYVRDPSSYYIRVWRKESRSYWTSRIDGASDIETACLKSLDLFLAYSAGSSTLPTPISTPKKRINKGVEPVRKGRIDELAHQYLKTELDKADSGLIKMGTVRNKQDTVKLHLLPYLNSKGVSDVSQIAVGLFDDYQVYRMNKARSEGKPNGLSRHTLRRELASIKMFLSYLHRLKLLNPYEFTKDLVPSVKLKDEDWDSNPPIRDDEEWKVIIKHLHRYVKEGEVNPKLSVGMNRKRFWTLVLLLKNSGLRPAEALALRWSDIETENIGRISQSKKEAEIQEYELMGRNLSELTNKELEELGKVDRYIVHIRVLSSKTGALREVTCNAAQALARWKRIIREYLDKYEEHFRYNGVELTRSEHDGLPLIPDDVKVFSIPERNEWTENDVTIYDYHWRTLIKRCKSELRGPILSPHPYCLYSLRSSKALELMENGVDIYLASRLMGHSPEILMKIYNRLPSRRRAKREAVPIEYGKRPDKERLVSLEDVH